MIYLDNFATTSIDPRVLDYFHNVLKKNYGNPSSVDHDLGKEAENLVAQSRNKIADLLDCTPGEITFTSGATESISLFLQGHTTTKAALLKRPLRVLSSPIEHPAVLENLQYLKQAGSIELDFIAVDSKGGVSLTEIESRCKAGLDLICTMAVNNEIGSINPIEEIARIAAVNKTLYFCDATQAIGKIPLSLTTLPDTVLAFSGHKFYAPKGIGVLIADKSLLTRPLFYGGSQQRGLRPGTINAPLIATLAHALELAVIEQEVDRARITMLRDNLQTKLQASIPSLVVNGDTENRVPAALHISIEGTQNKQIIARIRSDLAISTGAACSSGAERPSHVLKSMKLPDARIEGALRISLGRFTTQSDIEGASQIISNAVNA